MRKILLTVVALLSVGSLSAQSANEWLDSLNRSLGKRYAMDMFVSLGTVESVDDELSGYLMVDGDGYYISLGEMEVFSDGKLRYEVNNSRKEVTEDRVNLDSHDLLSNPTRAFSFLDEEFSSSVITTTTYGVTLMLKPLDGALGITAIMLSLERSGSRVLPTKLSYDYDGDIVTISLEMVDTTDIELRRWDKSAYRAYDIVSFL